MEIEESPERSASLQSFEGSILYDDEDSEAFDSREGGEGSSTGNDIGLAMKSQFYYHSKPPFQSIGGVRAIELVGSKFYRTPHGFQKEATFPCQPLPVHASSSNYEGSDARSKISSHSQTQSSPKCSRHGPLERFTLMVGENILHFKIVKAPIEQNCFDEPRSTSDECKCSLCGKVLQNRGAWEIHLAEVHCSSKRYRCDICNAWFNTKVSLVSHMRYHPGPRPYRCTVCTKTFCRSTSLALHMKMHTTGHRHFCQICGRWFKSFTSLTEHENACLAKLNGDFLDLERPFRWQCTYCEKMFHHRRDKNIHERVHTGEKPYTCGYCGRGFTQSQTLTIHIRTHTGEKPYPCGICGHEFRDSSALRKHEYRHAMLPSSLVSSLYGDSAIEVEVGDHERSWNGVAT